MTLELLGKDGANIWDAAKLRFGEYQPLGSSWLITQAKLVILFRPEKGRGQGKSLPVTITMPHGCDLKERTDRERLVGEKYLRRWQLLEEI